MARLHGEANGGAWVVGGGGRLEVRASGLRG
jgi:hypothetical protein